MTTKHVRTRRIAKATHRRRVRPKRRGTAPPSGRVRLPSARKAKRSPSIGVTQRARQAVRCPRTKVGFVFCNDPDPMLVERMWALEASERFETHAIFWHRANSALSFPFSAAPFSEDRFHQVTLPDPCRGIVSRTALTLVFAMHIKHWIRRHDIEILHVIYPNMLIAAFLATLGQRTQIVYDLWDVNRSGAMSIPQRMVYRQLLSKTRLVLATSPAFIDRFQPLQQILAPGTSTAYISNAPFLERSRVTPHPAKTNAAGPLVIGCVGNLRVPAQLRMLVDAVGQVRSTAKDVRIRLSGAGSQSSRVLQLAAEHDFVEYTGPYDYHRDAEELYAALDIVYAVYPLSNFNYRVHIARRLHDAVLSATPVVVSRDSHMADIVAEEGIGWAIGHASTEDLVDLLSLLYDDRSRLVEASACTLRNVSRHSFARFRRTYVEAYIELQKLLPSQHLHGPAVRHQRDAS